MATQINHGQWKKAFLGYVYLSPEDGIPDSTAAITKETGDVTLFPDVAIVH